MSRLPATLAGVVLSLAAVWTVAAQTSPPSPTVSQVIPITASVPVTLDDGSVQTVTVPLTVTLNIDVSVAGTAIGAEIKQSSVAPVAAEVTLENAGDFLPALADMPDGWNLRQEGEGSTNEELAESWPDPAAALEELNALGRLGSYYRTFQIAGFPAYGNAHIIFSLVLFDSEEGASGALALYRERDQSAVDNGDYDSLSPLSVSGLGDDVSAYTRTKAVSKEGAMDGHDEHSINFAKGNVMASITSRSFPSLGDIQQLIDFARWIAQRLP